MGCEKNLFGNPIFNEKDGNPLKLLGVKQEVQEASEPSDYIWENL